MTPILAFFTESGLLKSLKVREAMISFENQIEIWNPIVETKPAASSANLPRATEKG